MNAVNVLLMLALLGGVAPCVHAATRCNLPAKESKDYLLAAEAVRKLPEFQEWSASHKFHVGFAAHVDQELLLEGRCYWSVSVYANLPERLEPWECFLVSRSSKQVIFVQDQINGEPISLSAWRKQRSKSIR